MPLTGATLVLGLIISLAGCQTEASAPAWSPTPLMPPIPVHHDVQRIAVLYPQSAGEWMQAHRRLEGATFQLKVHRPHLSIVDRVNLPILLGEHQFQFRGLVEDGSAVHIGRLLGVDSVLRYRIDGPSPRDRLWARRASDLPPITVTCNLFRVESAEVLYHRLVVSQIEDEPGSAGAGDHADSRRARTCLRVIGTSL